MTPTGLPRASRVDLRTAAGAGVGAGVGVGDELAAPRRLKARHSGDDGGDGKDGLPTPIVLVSHADTLQARIEERGRVP
jgi:hypothetical protein